MKLTDLKAIKKQYTEAIKSNGKELLQQEFKVFFEAVPEVLTVKWRQYTPYFSDGDPCYFSAHEFCVQLEKIKDEENSYGDYEDGYLSSYDFKKDASWQDDIVKNMDPLLKEKIIVALDTLHENAHDNDLLEAVFGDHVTILATREGFDVEGYEHD